ncbi:Ig-like domain-containing protein [Aequorivita sp. SDUM287046]|uniref:Ig-like domain-containing protein n=1 Tax=Aequorivita aurantiaca TaxID=3053356 RepID=A0ABT8DE71_9FLAO|nr:Ig-like domain-containing protein [Aequorivita aurantiaca]MDN3722844.1 Ig-like domain-containing protein [Aequorivita aurantiaca]
MKHRLLYLPIAFLFILSFVDCAKKGTPSGGPRDTIPPIIVKSNPENYNTNFNGSEIEIRFDEYIKLKDLSKELIISPPMEYTPIITPLSTSKTLKIKILDTLKPNTTYSFNFGRSIVDNNEGNQFDYYKYIFSTGSYIDSLKLSGRAKDAQLIFPEIPTTVMLYETGETYSDSLIYFQKPTYVTVTTDTTGVFEFANLKGGQYMLVALKEKNNDYTFQPQNDKIGFIEKPITIPTDSFYSLTLFKETSDYKVARPNQIGQNHIIFGYEGQVDSLNVQLLSASPQDFISTFYKDEKKDTIHYWYKPSIEADSLNFMVANGARLDTVTVRMRELYKDSLNISAVKTGVLKLRDTFKLRVNTPITIVDAEKFQVITKDSTLVDATVQINKKYNLAEVFFPKTEEQTYSIQLLPGAITDFFERNNDTLQYSVNTRLASDYGTLNLTLNNANRFPIIVQIIDSKYNVVAEEYLTQSKNVFFDELSPDKYFLRIVYDDNGNKQWDTGSFLNRMAPERIIYYPKQIEVRANWSLNETFTLK